MRNNTLSTLTKMYIRQYQMLTWMWEATITWFSVLGQLAQVQRRTIVRQSSEETKLYSPVRHFIAEGVQRNAVGELKYVTTLFTITHNWEKPSICPEVGLKKKLNMYLHTNMRLLETMPSWSTKLLSYDAISEFLNESIANLQEISNHLHF